MISTSDFKKGSTVEIDGTLYRMEDVHHVKTKKSAIYRVKLRDLRAGYVVLQRKQGEATAATSKYLAAAFQARSPTGARR